MKFSNIASASKIIFFDVDGTLMDFNAVMPESTKKALEMAHENGHILIVCTGRSVGQLQKEILSMPFDGYICAAGAYVIYQGEVISKTSIPQNMLNKILDFFQEKNMVYALQCIDHMETHKAVFTKLIDTMKYKLKVNQKQIDSVLAGLKVYKSRDELQNVEKTLFYEADLTIDEVKELLGEKFQVVDMSFVESTRISGEISPAGINKAYGMQKILELLEKTVEDAIAFGDSTNDIEMLKYAGLGIAMGNASEEVKKAAGMITADISDDGIYKAMCELDLF